MDVNSLNKIVKDGLFNIQDKVCEFIQDINLIDAISKTGDDLLKDLDSFFQEESKILEEIRMLPLILSREHSIDKILEILMELARRICLADAGTIYLKDSTNKRLNFVLVHNDSLNIKMGGVHGSINWKPLELFDEFGVGNTKSIATQCALTAKTIIIDNVYTNTKYDFKGTKEFDKKSGYKTYSVVVVPIKNHFGSLIGVIQLLNKKSKDNKLIEFSKEDRANILILSSYAGSAIHFARQQKLIEYLKHKINRDKNVNSYIASFATMDSIDNIEIELQKNTQKRLEQDFISAIDYMQDMENALEEELIEMEAIEDELADELIEFSENHQNCVRRFGKLLLEYKKLSNLFIEFKIFNQTLGNIANFLVEKDNCSIELLEEIGDLICQWRRTIFIDKNADDIHYLDSVILKIYNRLINLE